MRLLGEALFAAKLRHTMRDPDITPVRVLARAEAEFAAVHGEMVRMSRELWPAWRPDEPPPLDDRALVRGTLDAITAEHPAPDEMVAFCRDELARIEAFCRERGVIGLVEEPLDIDWTPEFLRAVGGAMLESPGPLDHGQKTFFSITPVREEWSADEVESYMREMNTRQLRLLTIHEGVPGHYLQMARANHGTSLARRVFRSGLFAEGWAVYVTQVMLDRGYGEGDPALWLVHWKFYLRAVANAILDVRIHTMGMTSEEAVTLMVDGAFQERAEALAKDERARLTATQLVDVLPRLRGDVGHRGRRATSGGGRGRGGRGDRAGASARRRLPADAGFRPAGAPRGCHLPRRPADPDPAPNPPGRGLRAPARLVRFPPDASTAASPSRISCAGRPSGSLPS